VSLFDSWSRQRTCRRRVDGLSLAVCVGKVGTGRFITKSLSICVESRIGDFPLAHSHEALPRAYAATHSRGNFDAYIRRVRETSVRNRERADRSLFQKDVRALPKLKP